MHHKATEKIYGNVTKNVVLHVENPDSETVSHFRNVHEVKNTHFRDAHEVKDASIQKSRDVKDNQDYIMITQDFLDNFKSNVLKTNGGFNLNSVKYHGSTSYHHGERLPPMFAERLRVLEEKANRKLKVNDKNFYKMKTRPTVHINITGCSTSDDVSATLKDVLSPISKGPGITVTRYINTLIVICKLTVCLWVKHHIQRSISHLPENSSFKCCHNSSHAIILIIIIIVIFTIIIIIAVIIIIIILQDCIHFIEFPLFFFFFFFFFFFIKETNFVTFCLNYCILSFF